MEVRSNVLTNPDDPKPLIDDVKEAWIAPPTLLK